MTENKGDLISREALKKKLTPIKLYGGVYCKAITEKDIDNAPTVSKKELQKIFYETAEKPELKELLAYECGKKYERPQGEWIDYNNTFYKCPDCGYLLEKCCPQCQNKVILPKGGVE